MKAISIRQPWAWAIVNGYKDVENRSRLFHYRGPVLIHAGKIVETQAKQVVRDLLALTGHDPFDMPEEFPAGGIVGWAHIDDCVTRHPSDWFTGPYGLVLSKAKPLPLAPYLGHLGLFDIDEAEVTRMGYSGLARLLADAAGQGGLPL